MQRVCDSITVSWLTTMEAPRERTVESTAAERRRQLAQRIQEQREDEVLDLHTRPSAHYVDNAFSLVTANMAIVSLVLGGVYMSRACEKPLAGFLVVLGFLAPWAACLPILLRQWFYLHLRLSNIVTIVVFLASALYVTWLLVGQRWAFESSAANCDTDLSTAANVVVFVLYLMLLLYVAKVVWYLAVRARYSYKQLCLSCFRDPYPNVLHMSEIELDQLESEFHDGDQPQDTTSTPEGGAAPPGRARKGDRKTRLLQDMQHHQHEIRQSIYRLLHPAPTGSDKAKVTPRGKANSVVAKPIKAKSKIGAGKSTWRQSILGRSYQHPKTDDSNSQPHAE